MSQNCNEQYYNFISDIICNLPRETDTPPHLHTNCPRRFRNGILSLEVEIFRLKVHLCLFTLLLVFLLAYRDKDVCRSSTIFQLSKLDYF